MIQIKKSQTIPLDNKSYLVASFFIFDGARKNNFWSSTLCDQVEDIISIITFYQGAMSV